MLSLSSNNDGLYNALISTLRKMIGLKTKLRGVDGYTGRGEYEYYAWRNSAMRIDIKLRGVAGKTAEIYYNNSKVADIALKDGAADQSFVLSATEIPHTASNTNLEVRQNDQAILCGKVHIHKP